jgi:heme exporter protein A
VIALAGVAVEIARTPILDKIDFELEAGHVLGVTGPNGAGKTTLLHLCATVRTPLRGTGRVFGADLARPIPPEVRRRICLVEHRPALYPQLSLRENLRFVADLVGRPSQVVEESLVTVGLSRAADRRLSHCSQGMARRTDLARALIIRPSLLLLDEAHSGLDAEAMGLVDHIIGGVRDRGGSAVVVSHDQPRLSLQVDHTIVLEAGRLVLANRPA